MKLYSYFILLFPLIVKSQDVQIDSCGIDNNSRLTSYEITYFEKALRNKFHDSVDLSDYRILFLHGNFGAHGSSKQHFFGKSGKPWFSENDYPSMELIVLTNEERKLLPEYDAILVTWSKIKCTEKMRKRFLANAIKNASPTENQPTE